MRCVPGATLTAQRAAMVLAVLACGPASAHAQHEEERPVRTVLALGSASSHLEVVRKPDRGFFFEGALVLEPNRLPISYRVDFYYASLPIPNDAHDLEFLRVWGGGVGPQWKLHLFGDKFHPYLRGSVGVYVARTWFNREAEPLASDFVRSTRWGLVGGVGLPFSFLLGLPLVVDYSILRLCTGLSCREALGTVRPLSVGLRF